MKGKAAGAMTGFLCAALVFSNMAGMNVSAMGEDGAGREVQAQESVSGNGIGEAPEEAGQEVQADSSREPETDILEEPAVPDVGSPEESGQEDGEPEGEDGETEPKDMKEEPGENGAVLEGAAEEEEEEEPEESVSENTLEESEREGAAARSLLSPQVYAAGRSFTVDGKTYNSMDADETYSAGDDITAYYFEADSLLYFDGTGPMQHWSGPVSRPWNEITPAVCVVGEGITTVGANAFYWPGHSIKSVSLPGTLKEIHNFAFQQNSAMETLILPEGLEKIGKRAFLGCHKIVAIDIPDSVTQIGEDAFYECREAVSVHVPGSVKEISPFAFAYCEAADIEIDEGVETIGSAAFQCCGCVDLVLPGSVKTIGERAFGNSKRLYSLTIPDSVTQIGPYAFTWCNSLFEITAGTGITSIGEKAFVVENEKKFRLYSENETVREYDWSGDRRVVAYRITFRNFDDAWSMTNLYGAGEKLSDYAPDVWDYSTEQEVLTFAGWEPELTEESTVTGDAEYVAVYHSEPRKYQITFKDYDGSGIGDFMLPYGADICASKPENPQRAADERHTYTFTGWEPELTEGAAVTGDAEYVAVYRSEPRKYQITFKDYDGGRIADFTLPYGADIGASKPENPRRAADERHTYTFTGWEPELTEGAAVTGDAEYVAVYRSEPRKYQITFKDYDGSGIADFTLPYGADIYAIKPEEPRRAADERHTYTFAGWEPELTEGTTVTGDAGYTAAYREEERQYTLTFLDYDGSILKEVKKPYGTVIADNAPTPEREADGTHTYTFTGWQPALDGKDTLTGDMAYEAVYSSDLRRCSVTFRDYDGSILKDFSVNVGDKVAGRAPAAARKDEGLSTYTFAGWQPALDKEAPVLGDITYTALYTRKTQTGISVEHEANHPSGKEFGPADIVVYPVYETYDTAERFQERITDREHPVDRGDIRLSADRIGRGDNAVQIEQTSTGCMAEIHVYGSYIDGISASYADAEVKAGTQISKFDVYFTHSRMGKDGKIQRGVIDRTGKVAGYVINGSASSVTVAEGDNRIRVTETETGEGHSCTIHIIGIKAGMEKEPGKEEPSDKEKEPEKEKPSDKKPGGDSGTGEKKQPGQEGEPGTSPESVRIKLRIPGLEKEVQPDGSCRIVFAWERTPETMPSREETGLFTDILVEAGKEAGGTDTAVPETEESPEISEPEKEQPVTGLEKPETGEMTEKPKSTGLFRIASASLAVMGMLMLAVMLLKGRRKTFHGVLTWEEIPAVRVEAPDGMTETVQEVIDRTEDLEECLAALKEGGAKTILPAAARMEISYKDADGQTRTRKGKADENRMLRMLSEAEGCTTADVRLLHDRYGIHIGLKFRV